MTTSPDMPAIERRECGRLTTSGKPCRNPLYGPHLRACGTHATDHDRDVAEAYMLGQRSAHDFLRRNAEGIQRDLLARKDAEIARLQEIIDIGTRRFMAGGDQIVEVGRYSYRYRCPIGENPLDVGDEVLLPDNWLTDIKGTSGRNIGTVTKLGSTYSGTMAYIVKRLSSIDADA